jgi:hypothetical protein
MLCLICNELLHNIITCELISCVSHINTISPPKVVTQLPKPNKDLSPSRARTRGSTPTARSPHPELARPAMPPSHATTLLGCTAFARHDTARWRRPRSTPLGGHSPLCHPRSELAQLAAPPPPVGSLCAATAQPCCNR